MIRTVECKRSLKEFTQMCVDHSRQPPWTKHRYYVIFVDDFSRKCWIFFMQKKDQTFSKFCEFKALVEKDTGRKVKALRSDNGGEYVSNEFKNFCASEGIRWELIAPHNPQQNGVAERKNKSIVGVAWVMLHDQGLPLHLWAEACNTIVYVQNRVLIGFSG
jgi:transposase InsO family protein